MLRPHPFYFASFVSIVMLVLHNPTPDWAESCMKRIMKFDDPDVLDAAIEIVVGLTGLNDPKRADASRIALRDDAARAAVHFGYRQTQECYRHCEEDLGIAV
jgi:hypothetical protein